MSDGNKKITRNLSRLNGHEFEQTVGDSEGQGSLACYSPWGHKESSTTSQLNNNNYEGLDTVPILFNPKTI